MTEFAEGGSLADGRYTLERRLGVGGMAAVWLARDERLGRLVAIKALSDALAGEEGYVRRFRREARVAAGLSHPNLVRVFDFGDDPRPYLVMEYVEGDTLAEQLREAERELDCDGVIRGLLDALDHVHEARIVHRDVKPANVLIAIRDDREHAFLTDFGVTLDRARTAELTQTGFAVGTADYMSPEQARGVGVDARADIYALGCVLYRALTGAVVYDRESDIDKMWAHIHAPAPALRDVRPDLPPALGEAVERALAKAPEDRQQTAGELARELRAAVAQS